MLQKSVFLVQNVIILSLLSFTYMVSYVFDSLEEVTLLLSVTFSTLMQRPVRPKIDICFWYSL